MPWDHQMNPLPIYKSGIILAHCRSFRKCGLWLGANLAVASSKVPCQVSTFPETSATRKYFAYHKFCTSVVRHLHPRIPCEMGQLEIYEFREPYK